MSSADVRDMLDLPGDGHPRPAKRQKTVVVKPTLKGVQREVYALMGDNAPPVQLNQHQYKSKPKLLYKGKVTPWKQTPFTTPSRSDGLVLHHWEKKPPASTETKELETPDSEPLEKPLTNSNDRWSKHNVRINGPDYTDDEYNAKLQSDEWTREETDYLVNLALEYDLRWVVIIDRYDFQPLMKTEPSDAESTAVAPVAKPRTMEDLKARYYQVAAKVMEERRPVHTMTTTEYDLVEKMKAFDPNQERKRKAYAESLLKRDRAEVAEEEILLVELKRIVANQERMEQERKELFARLESPQTLNNNYNMYQSSSGLSNLMQTLMTADKNRKRKSLVGSGDGGSSPAIGLAAQNAAASGHRDSRESAHRESASGPSGPNKKGTPGAIIERKKLSEAELLSFGVMPHERLTAGVSFRHEKVTKLVAGKSNVQATKIGTALTELSIPTRLVMPTSSVAAADEKLINSIGLLLDVKKNSEKLEGEIKVAMFQKEEKEKKERAERGETTPEPEAENGAEADAEGDTEAKTGPTVGEKEVKEEKAPSRAPSARPPSGHKRSASVLSAVSDKSSKRPRK